MGAEVRPDQVSAGSRAGAWTDRVDLDLAIVTAGRNGRTRAAAVAARDQKQRESGYPTESGAARRRERPPEFDSRSTHRCCVAPWSRRMHASATPQKHGRTGQVHGHRSGRPEPYARTSAPVRAHRQLSHLLEKLYEVGARSDRAPTAPTLGSLRPDSLRARAPARGHANGWRSAAP